MKKICRGGLSQKDFRDLLDHVSLDRILKGEPAWVLGERLFEPLKNVWHISNDNKKDVAASDGRIEWLDQPLEDRVRVLVREGVMAAVSVSA